MQLSLRSLSWQAQIGAFVAVCFCATAGFWHFFVRDARAELAARLARLNSLRADVVRGRATVSRLPEFEGQVSQLERRLRSMEAVLPEEKDMADILRRLQDLAAQSHLSIQRFTPQPSVQQGMYAEVPFKLQTEGTYQAFAAFLERIGRFPRIINIHDLSIKAKPQPEPGATIVAECIATTFVRQDTRLAGTSQQTMPRRPSLGK